MGEISNGDQKAKKNNAKRQESFRQEKQSQRRAITYIQKRVPHYIYMPLHIPSGK